MDGRKLKALCGLCLLAALLPAQAQEVFYIHTDALGSPVAETDANRNVVARFEYEPYGKRIGTGNDDKPGYTGHVMDAVTGLVQMQQRYYDPGIGVFLSVDPVTAYDNPMEQFHRYRYANNNPFRFIDPDGRSSQDRWYGHNERDFRDWVHKEKQDSGRRHDYSRQEIDKLKRTWEKEGRPKGKGGTSGRGGTRRGQRGSVSPGSFLRGNLIIFTLTTMFNIPELNASEDEIVRERMESQPEGKVTVGDVVPVRDQPVDEAPAPEKPKPEDQDENL